ncbi:hypothetical protein BV898_16666 [Hypsibius exemplaris]|uniref:Uncharacterized protein n=1 Tax=Hypsibius exemplaris TaxID=2072580 RepID=A0A9X6NGA9_HYPEX|nr:hypothetical protein BV898_16666 [Hypsibius exemplaris]
MAVPISHRLIVDPQRIKMIGLTGFFHIALLCSQQRGDASPIGCAPRPSVQPALGPEKACVLPEGPVCPFGRQRLRSLHLSCEFDNTSNAETTSAAFHRLPLSVCSYGRSGDVRDGAGALVSKCVKNKINYTNPLQADMLISPGQATASLQTGYTSAADNNCTQFHLTFWFKFDGIIKVANESDPDRFFLEVWLHRLDSDGGQTGKPGRVLWGNQPEDYKDIHDNEWAQVHVPFTKDEPFSINFFAHHNDGCQERIQSIHLDSVRTEAETLECRVRPTNQPTERTTIATLLRPTTSRESTVRPTEPSTEFTASNDLTDSSFGMVSLSSLAPRPSMPPNDETFGCSTGSFDAADLGPDGRYYFFLGLSLYTVDQLNLTVVGPRPVSDYFTEIVTPVIAAFTIGPQNQHMYIIDSDSALRNIKIFAFNRQDPRPYDPVQTRSLKDVFPNAPNPVTACVTDFAFSHLYLHGGSATSPQYTLYNFDISGYGVFHHKSGPKDEPWRTLIVAASSWHDSGASRTGYYLYNSSSIAEVEADMSLVSRNPPSKLKDCADTIPQAMSGCCQTRFFHQLH